MSDVSVEQDLTIALHLDTIPNTSYFPRAIVRAIHQYLDRLPEIQIAEDPYALYAHYTHGSPHYKLVIDTHLDHPGFILLGKGMALPVGTIAEPGSVQRINEQQRTIPVSFHDQEGNQSGEGFLHTLVVKEGSTRLHVHQDYPTKPLPVNTQAVVQVPSKQEGSYVLMRSADNLSVTALAISYLQWVVSAHIEGDVTIIFTKIEEVRQVSATAIAQQSRTPFGMLDNRTQIIVLEAGLVGSTERTRQVEASMPDLNYEGGTLLRVSDHEWPYQRDGQTNLAEALLLHARDAVSTRQAVQVQHGPSIGNCNALPYAFFSHCPHVSSLMIPCVNKHNFDQQGQLVAERIAVADMQSVRLLLEQATLAAQGEVLAHPEQMLLPGRHFPGNAAERIEAKKKEWQGALAWAAPRLRGAYFAPTTPLELVRCRAASLKSRCIGSFS